MEFQLKHHGRNIIAEHQPRCPKCAGFMQLSHFVWGTYSQWTWVCPEHHGHTPVGVALDITLTPEMA